MNKERSTPVEHSDPLGNQLGDPLGDTIRIRRPPRVFTTDLGKNVWMGDVDPCELELQIEVAPSTDPYDSARPEEAHAMVWRRSATAASYPGRGASAGERWRHR